MGAELFPFYRWWTQLSGESNSWPNKARGRSKTQPWIPWLPSQSFLLQNSCLLPHSCCLEKPIPVVDTAYIINIMVHFILSLKHLLYTLFYQIVLQLSKRGEKEARRVECSLCFTLQRPLWKAGVRSQGRAHCSELSLVLWERLNIIMLWWW